MLVAKLPGSIYAILAMNAGPKNGRICLMSRRRPRPSKTEAALAATFVSPFLVPRFTGDRQSRIVLQAHSPALKQRRRSQGVKDLSCLSTRLALMSEVRLL